jgi:uncharacterized membrane protein
MMTRAVLGGLAAVLGSNVVYHVALKSMPRGVDPFLATATAYVVALVTTLLVWVSRGGKPAAIGASVREMNWTNLIVGVAIVGVELGFLLVYRAGGDVSKSSALTSTALAVLLALIGLTVFSERLSATQWGGLLLCGSGIVLLARG